jgi:hypothetical protein
MPRNLKKELTKDLGEIIFGTILSVLAFLLLSIWRSFDTSTLLFIQIIIVTIASYALLLIYAQVRKSRSTHPHRLFASLMVFVLLSFLLLNIDRSRSVHVLKWVSQTNSDFEKANIQSITETYHLQPSEIKAYDARLREQTELGFLSEKSGDFQLTLLGRLFVWFADAVSKVANLRGYLSI